MTNKTLGRADKRTENEDRKIKNSHLETLAQDFDPPREDSFRQ
jgi:hypothetical protein